MSLETLKKSEQQRQEQNVPQQKKVRKRTLTLTSRRSARRSYWLLGLLLPLLLLGGGWWLYNETSPTLEPIPELTLEKSAPSETSLPKQPEPAVSSPAPPTNDLQQLDVAAQEAAPVPSIYVSVPAVPAKSLSAKQQRLAVEKRQADVDAVAEMMNADEPVAGVSNCTIAPLLRPVPGYARAGVSTGHEHALLQQ